MYYPILAYTVVIVVMMWRAAALNDSSQKSNLTSYLVIIGAVSFAFGDTLIAFDRYYEKILQCEIYNQHELLLAQFFNCFFSLLL